MPRRPSTFRQRDLERAIRAYRAAGIEVRAEIEDGKIKLIPIDVEGRARPPVDIAEVSPERIEHLI